MSSFREKAYIVLIVVVLYLFLVIGWIGIERYVYGYIGTKLQEIERQYDISVLYDDIKLKGLAKVQFTNPVVVRAGADTLFSTRSVHTGLNVAKLITLRTEITGIDIKSLKLNKTDLPLNNPAETDFALKAERIFDILYNILPPDMSLRNVRISGLNEQESLLINIKELVIKEGGFYAEVNGWGCKGAFLKEEKKIELRIYTKDNEKIAIPFLKEKYGPDIAFDTLAFEVQSAKNANGILTLQGKGGAKGLTFFDERLVTNTLELNMGYANFTVNIGRNFVEIDNRTSLICNKLKFNPYLRVEKNADWKVNAAIDKADFPAKDFFESIPKGLFSHIEGLQADGTLSYRLLLDADLAKPDRLKFSSTLTPRDFRILAFGNTDLRLMNEPFTHRIYRQGETVRTFVLGDKDPGFRPYKQISRYLPAAIMHAEDADFFTHQGFYPGAFERSLIENIKEWRFARGGSSLSMQVVKNVFLSQDKIISRKLEEIMIVWLIETCKLTSKQRMFEVYMNITEWGPDVYGITEAARYYFEKEPSELTLTECIFLAYILPDPKRVKNHFNGLQIKPDFRPFLNNAVKRLYQRHWITERDRAMFNPQLKITGRATEHLLSND